MLQLISTMTGNQQFFLCIGGQKSKMRKNKNRVPQGSVLAKTLFSINLSDMPTTKANKFEYADDWAIAFSIKSGYIGHLFFCFGVNSYERFHVWWRQHSNHNQSSKFQQRNLSLHTLIKIPKSDNDAIQKECELRAIPFSWKTANTSRRYSNSDVIFCQKTMTQQILLLHLVCEVFPMLLHD